MAAQLKGKEWPTSANIIVPFLFGAILWLNSRANGLSIGIKSFLGRVLFKNEKIKRFFTFKKEISPIGFRMTQEY